MWTWRMFDQGFDFAEVCQIRRLAPADVRRELWAAMEQGRRAELHWVLSPEQIELLQRFVHHSSGDGLVQFAKRLPKSISHWDMLFYLRCTQATDARTTV
jgi:hypothetical protein